MQKFMIHRSNKGHLAALLLAGTVLGMACSSKVKVHHVREGFKPKNEGFYYYLPQTMVVADVKIKKTTQVPGPYHAYAEKFLGYPVLERKTFSYEIEDIELRTEQIPDPNQVYFIEASPNAGFMLEFESNGLLRHVNWQTSEEEKRERRQENVTRAEEEAQIRSQLNLLNMREKLDTIYKREVYDDSVVVERWQIEKVLIKSTLEESAREAAARIASIRSNRYQLISFNEDVQYPEGTLETMLEELDQMESAYFQLFTGYSTTETIHYRYTYLPSLMDQGYQTLFKFNPEKGVNDSLKMIKETVYIIPKPTQLTESIRKNRSNLYYERGKNPEEDQRLAYRIPEPTEFQILWNNKVLTTEKLPIAQLGTVQRIPYKQLKNMRISFDPESGTIRTLSIDHEKH
jgi:hypothetical protein